MDRGQREYGTAEGGAEEGRRWKQWRDRGIDMWERKRVRTRQTDTSEHRTRGGTLCTLHTQTVRTYSVHTDCTLLGINYSFAQLVSTVWTLVWCHGVSLVALTGQ